MDERRPRLHRLYRVEDGRQLRILHLDQGEGLFGRVHIVRRHCRHFLGKDCKGFHASTPF